MSMPASYYRMQTRRDTERRAEQEAKAQAATEAAQEAARAAKTAQIIQEIQPIFESRVKGDETMTTNYDDIIARHAAAARAEIEREEAKSAEQKA